MPLPNSPSCRLQVLLGVRRRHRQRAEVKAIPIAPGLGYTSLHISTTFGRRLHPFRLHMRRKMRRASSTGMLCLHRYQTGSRSLRPTRHTTLWWRPLHSTALPPPQPLPQQLKSWHPLGLQDRDTSAHLYRCRPKTRVLSTRGVGHLWALRTHQPPLVRNSLASIRSPAVLPPEVRANCHC